MIVLLYSNTREVEIAAELRQTKQRSALLKLADALRRITLSRRVSPKMDTPCNQHL